MLTAYLKGVLIAIIGLTATALLYGWRIDWSWFKAEKAPPPIPELIVTDAAVEFKGPITWDRSTTLIQGPMTFQADPPEDVSNPPILVVKGPGTYSVTFNYSRAKMERIAADDKNYSERAYAVLALEILRLKAKCGEPTG